MLSPCISWPTHCSALGGFLDYRSYGADNPMTTLDFRASMSDCSEDVVKVSKITSCHQCCYDKVFPDLCHLQHLTMAPECLTFSLYILLKTETGLPLQLRCHQANCLSGKRMLRLAHRDSHTTYTTSTQPRCASQNTGEVQAMYSWSQHAQ